MAKKFDEMKEVISANSTPVKGAIGNATSALTSLITEEDSTDGSSEINPDGKPVLYFQSSYNFTLLKCKNLNYYIIFVCIYDSVLQNFRNILLVLRFSDSVLL